MNFDLRFPIGIMFSIFGAMLVVFGFLNGIDSTRLGININLDWGLVLLVFGLWMLWLALRARGRHQQK